MGSKIQIYIKNEEVLVTQGVTRPVVDHYCTDREIVKTERVMADSDLQALNIVKEFANEKGIPVEVCDVNTTTGKLKASLRGIRTTPTIIVGKVRIEGVLASELLRNRLESCFSK